jgi:hypothetical protein
MLDAAFAGLKISGGPGVDVQGAKQQWAVNVDCCTPISTAVCTYTNASIAISGVNEPCPEDCTKWVSNNGYFTTVALALNGVHNLGVLGGLVLPGAMTIKSFPDEDCAIGDGPETVLDIAINFSCSESAPHFTTSVVAFLPGTAIGVYDFFNSAGFNPGESVPGIGCGGSLTVALT